MGGERLQRGAQLRGDAAAPTAKSPRAAKCERGSLQRRDRRVLGRLEPGANPGTGERVTKVSIARQFAADLLDDLLDEEIAEIDPGEALLAIRDRIERRDARLVRRDIRALVGEERRDRVGDRRGQRDFDEDQRLVDQRSDGKTRSSAGRPDRCAAADRPSRRSRAPPRSG